MDTEQAGRTGFELYQRGKLAEAELAYAQILGAEPDNFSARHMLGLIRHAQGRHPEALELIGGAIRLNPTTVAATLDYGHVLKSLGRLREALACCNRAMALEPACAQAYHDRGEIFRQAGKLEEALADYGKAAQLKPDYADAHINQGTLLHGLGRLAEALASYDKALALGAVHAALHSNQGVVLQAFQRFDEALASYDRAIASDPAYAPAHYNRGNVLRDLGRLDDVLVNYDRAVAADPAFADAFHNRGLVLQHLGRSSDALAAFDRAIELKPDFAEAHTFRGAALQELKRPDEALASCDRAIALRPDYAEGHYGRGLVLQSLARPDEALAAFDAAIALKPLYAGAHCNRGVTLHDLARFDEALASHDRAIALKPDLAQAWFNKSLTQLLRGDLDNGWRNYEWRKRTAAPSANRSFPAPLLTSAREIPGKRILVHWEQGLGDTMQFFRYAALVRQAGGRVLFAPQKSLKRLLATADMDIELVDADDASLAFDYHSPLMSLPGIFGATAGTILSGMPYLFAEDALARTWRTRLGDGGFKIGICWKGNSALKFDITRSFSLRHFLPLSQVPGIRLISLQKGDGESELENLDAAIESLGADFDAGPDAFVDSAAVMQSLDLVITSDTSIAHLAGALGVPTWVALQHVPDWRWLMDRADTPWYPNVRLFRQSSRGDWASVFSAIQAELEQTLAHAAPRKTGL